MKKKIKLAVVDDQQLFRKGLISLIDEFDELSVMLEASNGVELLEQLKAKKPDVILLDVEMPVMNGIDATGIIRSKYPDVKILILSLYNDEEMILHLVKNGAHGFLLKDNSIEVVVDAIYAVTESGYFFNDRVSKVMVDGLVRNNTIRPHFERVELSEREIEVLRLICKEHTNKEIAEKLFISPRTVDGHREKILQKTNAKNVVGMVMYAIKHKLLD